MKYTKYNMPLLDARQFKQSPRKRRKKYRTRLFIFLGLCVVLLASFYLRTLRTTTTKEQPPKREESNSEARTNTKRVVTGFKNFTGEEFKILARSIHYPNTQLFEFLPEITGNKEADNHIRSLAEKRGFMQTSIPVAAISRIDEPRLDLMGDDLLQPLAAQDWKNLKQAARKENIPLSLLSAYRSPEYQRTLFLSRLNVTPAEIVAKTADSKIIQTLLQTAPPGYSRHHTGYTIDLWCEDGSKAFVSSVCYEWIKADNYKKAKLYGWIPSYPEGVKLQGPEPEPWEYVWVDSQLLMK